MITDSMSPAELHKVLDTAQREAMGRCNARVKPEIDRLIRQKKLKLPYIGMFEYVRDHTKYVVDYLVQQGKNYIYSSPHVYAIYESGYGRKAVHKLNKDFVIELGPHFFSRYSERAHVDKIGDDLIKHFMLHNTHIAWQHTYRRSEGNTTDMMFSCDEGAIFGQLYASGEGNEKVFAFEGVTFLSNENMAHTNKTELTDEFQKVLAEVKEVEDKFGQHIIAHV